MKLTQQQLKRIITEEVQRALKERDVWDVPAGGRAHAVKGESGYVPQPRDIVRVINNSWEEAHLGSLGLGSVLAWNMPKKADPAILKAAIACVTKLGKAITQIRRLNDAVIADIKKKYPQDFEK